MILSLPILSFIFLAGIPIVILLLMFAVYWRPHSDKDS